MTHRPTLPINAPPADFLGGGGAMATLIRSVDWANTPIGGMATWPQSLKTTLHMLLTAKFGMFLWWGPDLVQFYNDAYRPSFGTADEKHPRAMGQRGQDCWGEIWDIIHPQIEQVMHTGIATRHENQRVPIFRNGILEEVYWTYTYNPIFGESGPVAGVLVVETETTSQVLDQRRMKVLRDLALALTIARSVPQVGHAAMTVLAQDRPDIPFALLYLRGTDPHLLQLIASTGLDPAALTRQGTPDPAAPTSRPLWDSLHSGQAWVRTPRASEWGAPPGDPEGAALPQQYILPLTPPNQQHPMGVLVVGLSPHRIFDGDYQDFLEVTAQQIGQGLATARAYEREQARQTELETAHADAETARQRLRDLFMQAPAFVAVVSGPNLVFELANPLYQQLVGHDQPLEGRPLLEALPDIEPSLLAIVRNVTTKGERFRADELPIVLDWNQDGTPYSKYLNFVYEPIVNRTGHPEGLMCVGNDVTEQVHARQRVEESDARFRALLNADILGVITVNVHGAILEANTTFLELIGYTRADLAAGTLRWMDPTADPARDAQIARDLRETGVFALVEREQIRKDGSRVPTVTGGALVNSAKGEAVIFVLDITERKKLEQRKDDFIALASHELKTPITSLKITAQLLQRRFEKSEDTDATRRLARMNEQIDKLTRLVESLLDVSRIAVDKVTLEVAEFDLDDLISEVVADLQDLSVQHTLVVAGMSAARVQGDRERIRQVLVNLITNATKYSPGAQQVIIGSQRAGEGVTVSVQDFGIGISADQQAKVFDRFFQVSRPGPAHHRAHPGLGLGLYICAEIVKRHGGTIGVESTAAGSTFRFTLPPRAPGL